MKKMFTKLSCAFLLVFANISISNAQSFSANLTLSAHLTGAQEVPAVTTNAYGAASFVLNATHDTLCIKATVADLSGPVTLVHIHDGDPGVTGPVALDLMPFLTGNTVSAMVTGGTLTVLLPHLLAGKDYINFHTSANPGGEIRGQITVETDHLLTASLDGAQEVPAVGTNAIGVAVFNLSQDHKTLSVNARVQALSGPITLAHLHTGAPGVSGGVAVDLGAGVLGNSISIVVDPTSFLSDLLAGNIYINVHTSANPNGEIRGQVSVPDSKYGFEIQLDGSQEVPAVVTNAAGLGFCKINIAMDSMWVDIIGDGLSGVPTLAHFHAGAPGIAGPVAVNLTPSINGIRISGVVTGGVGPLFLAGCLVGEVYANVHTSANPGGEIRGKVLRTAREGMTFSIDGSQEVPATSSAATGTGVATIDREKGNLHFMFAVNDLSGPVTLAHFHEAAAGASGPVLFDIMPSLIGSGTSNGGFGYIDGTSATPFDATAADKFLTQNVYANIHTGANPGGEVRGQVLFGGDCFVNDFTGIPVLNPSISNLNVYPNPAANYVSLDINNLSGEQAVISIIDVQGRNVISNVKDLNAGNNKFTIDLNTIGRGIYFLRIDVDGKSAAYTKIVKL